MSLRTLKVALGLVLLGAACSPSDLDEGSQAPVEEEDVDNAQLALMSESDIRIKNYTLAGLLGVNVGEIGRLAYVQNRGLFTDSGGSWFGVGGEVFNVKAFGALGDGLTDDRPAIQGAIDAAYAAPHGGVVYFPAGEYKICTSSLVLPRSYTKALTLRGDGPTMSIVRAMPNDNTSPLTAAECASPLGVYSPVITFDGEDHTPSVHYTFEGLQVSRDNAGSAFAHVQPTLSQANERLRYAVFRDIRFIIPVGASAPAVHIQGAQFVRFENVVTDGGEVGLRMEDGSHVTMQDVRSPHSDGGAQNGIYIARGGTYNLTNVRINSVNAGSGLWLDDTQGITINTINFEGDYVSKQLHVDGTTSEVVIINPSIAQPDKQVSVVPYGLYVGGDAQNIKVIGGAMYDFAGKSGAALKVASGARDVSIEGVHLYGEPNDNVSIDSGVTRVKASFVYGNPAQFRRVRAAGWFCTLSRGGSSESVRECEQGTVSSSSARTITSLTDGYEGQRLILIFTDSNTTLSSSGGNLKLTDGTFAATTEDTIQLIFNGASWLELGRTTL